MSNYFWKKKNSEIKNPKSWNSIEIWYRLLFSFCLKWKTEYRKVLSLHFKWFHVLCHPMYENSNKKTVISIAVIFSDYFITLMIFQKKTIENTDKNMNYDRQYGVRLHDREIEYFHWNWVLFRIFQRQFKIANLSFDIVFFLFLFTTHSVLFKWQTRNEKKKTNTGPVPSKLNGFGKKILCKNIWTKRK